MIDPRIRVCKQCRYSCQQCIYGKQAQRILTDKRGFFIMHTDMRNRIINIQPLSLCQHIRAFCMYLRDLQKLLRRCSAKQNAKSLLRLRLASRNDNYANAYKQKHLFHCHGSLQRCSPPSVRSYVTFLNSYSLFHFESQAKVSYIMQNTCRCFRRQVFREVYFILISRYLCYTVRSYGLKRRIQPD